MKPENKLFTSFPLNSRFSYVLPGFCYTGLHLDITISNAFVGNSC
ncbi:hypothetical protein VCRA217O315_170117 [Vibrio crassostreae]|nr:hypothetical protein VCRA217O315_170117 [Vibrio crassostreae]